MEKTILMETNRLDDDSVVVNFNLLDEESDEVIGDGGYVNIRQEENEYAIFVFNSEGDIVSEVRVPFAFKTFAD